LICLGLYQYKETTFEKYSLSIMFDKKLIDKTVETQTKGVLLVEETGVPGDTHRPAASH
jgi:hypothetical protein